MAKIRELVAEIIKELKELQNSTDPIPNRNDDFPLPSMIPAGNFGGIIVSKSIEKHMTSVGRVIKNDERLNSRFGKKDWDRLSRPLHVICQSVHVIKCPQLP